MKTGLAIKRLDQPDPQIISKIAALEEEAFGRGGLNEWHLPVVARHGRLYVLLEGERVVGAASLMRDWASKTAYLFDLVVAKEQRRQGRGRFLMERVIVELGREGVKQLELTVAPDNVEAVGLYKQLGFEAGEMLTEEYGKGQDRWRMALNITRS